MKRLPGWLNAALVGGTFVGLVWWERRRPLRAPVESKLNRDVRNLAVATISAVSLQLAQTPVTRPLTELVERRKYGLLKQFSMPNWLETTLAVVLLDYTLYIWHVLTHRIDFLWRFHKVHHVDLDLDASTALRFHAGEMLISIPWRAMQVALIGVSSLALSIWQTSLLLSIMFHHSNARLPLRVERWLNWIIVTPRMHGIHHSIVRDETDSNWSSGLTIWDWLHGTLRLNIPQDEITIGVPAYRHPEQVTLPKILEMPFVGQPSDWLLPDGREPYRRGLPVPQHQLMP